MAAVSASRSAFLVAFACKTGSAKSANVDMSALAERTLSRCSVICPRLPGDASIRESHSRSWCPIALLAIAELGQHHVQLVSGRRAKCHTYQEPCCHPGLVVSSSTARCSWVAVVVVLLFLNLYSPILAVASSCSLTYHQIHPDPYHPPHTTSLSPYTTLPCSASTGHRSALPQLLPESLHVPPAWDCACKPLDPFQIPHEGPTSSTPAPRHNHNQSRQSRPQDISQAAFHKSAQRRIR